MSTTATTEEHHGAQPDEPGAHEHPSDSTYYLVALVLAALTAIEVGIYYVSGGFTFVPLLLLMVAKFVVVIAFFMHLRFDSPLFRRLFFMGLGMACFIYTMTFFIFGIFHG